LTNAGIPTYIDDKHAIAHNKIMIIDREIVVTGSFNFTKAAEEKNAENVLIIRDKGLAKVYLKTGRSIRDIWKCMRKQGPDDLSGDDCMALWKRRESINC
jgi:phosphatidylserine/phosphatidylglycerophosphate/cardiolipin synthase-like enzyme